MAPKDPNDCVVTVTIEMGHQANFLKEPSPEGFTHDWTVFVRGFEGSRLEYFVEKVVFKLHKTFKSPVRVITEPPFRVTESGYAGFILPIEIHFKNKQTPRKIVFSYDLFLNAKDSPPINNVRYEKLKFQNPTPEFKAKLIKAGGVEQGPEHPSGDHFGSPVRSEKRALPKIPKDKEKDKEKIKKKKKSSPQFKSASPAPSLSSLSPMSSDNEDSYAAPPPPPPAKKEKELSVKRESSSSAPQSKQDSSSSHKDKSKHRSSSSNPSHKERSDKDASHKSHQHKDKTKDRERSSSHKDKEAVKKERDSNSQKVVKEHVEARKEREGSHSSGKSSTSSQIDNKVVVQPSHKERETGLQSKDKDTLGSSKEKLHSSSKDREKISKEKHSSHRDVSHTSHSEPKKGKDEASKEKISKESDRHHKSHKRHMESADVENKKLKRSSSVASIDEKSVKVKSSSEKEKHVSRDNKEKESSKEVKESKLSSSDKSKHEKSRHSEKQRHSHSSETKQKESSAKRSEMPQKHEKVSKPESLTHSERLAMTADFQPQLLLSPLKSKSDEEESPSPSPLVEKAELKSSTSHSSPSSAVSGEDKSDHEMLDTQADEDKHIVSGLTDSDSDSEEDVPYVKSQQKDLKSILNKQSQQTTQVNKSSLEKVVRRSPAEEKQKKVEYEPTEDSARKYSKAEKRAHITEPTKSKSVDRKIENSDADVQQVTATNNTDSQNCNGLDILAPNGMSIGELIAINEQIEKAQTDLNEELIEKVIHVIGETDDFDISDVSLSFDICSVDKTVVLQIQNLLREYQLQCCS